MARRVQRKLIQRRYAGHGLGIGFVVYDAPAADDDAGVALFAHAVGEQIAVLCVDDAVAGGNILRLVVAASGLFLVGQKGAEGQPFIKVNMGDIPHRGTPAHFFGKARDVHMQLLADVYPSPGFFVYMHKRGLPLGQENPGQHGVLLKRWRG